MLNKKFKKAISAVTMFATVVVLSGVSMLAPLTASAATIVDGDLIKSNATNSDGTPTIGSLDVYIVKIVGTKKFKRLVLNPNIFNSYGHLKWENIKTVSQAEEDGFTTSSLVRVDGDTKVYALTPVAGGDTGAKSWVNVTADQFVNGAGSDPDSIYTINGTDAAAYSGKADITTVTALKAFYKDGTLPAGEVSEGALKVSLSADSAESANIPNGVGVEFAKFNLTASDKGDVTVDSITFTAGGLDASADIDDIAIYDEDGARLNATLKDVVSDVANVNVDGLVIKAGETETITVKAMIAAGQEGVYALGIDAAADINSDASSVSGSFPIQGNEMNAVTASGLSTLTFTADGSINSVDLGDEGATLAKFKVAATGADGTLSRISLKKDAAMTATVDAAENFELYANGVKVAEADEMVNKYITFNIADGVLVEKDENVKFTVKGDVVGGASKVFAIGLDSAIDAEGMGKKYPAIIADSYAAQSVNIEGGAVTIEKVDADPLKVKISTDNVELGSFKITANSGEDVTLESIKFAITATGDGADAAAFTDLTNIEIYDATDKSTYDLSYYNTDLDGDATEDGDVNDAAVKQYRNMDLNINMESGETHELIVRGDTGAAANGNTYIAKLTATDAVIKTVEDDVAITDKTPSVVTLKKVTVEASGIDFTVKALSAAKNAVAGSEGVEAISFSVKATASDATINELQFANDTADSTMDSTLVSGFALYNADGTLIKEVGTSALSGEEVTFSDLDIDIAADTTKSFYVSTDLVADSANATKTLQLEISGYTAEDEEGDDVYDAAEGGTLDGDVTAGTFRSARTITVVGVGSLAVSIDNTLSETKKDVYAVAGTSVANLAALKLKATNEDVEVTKIVLNIAGITAGSEDEMFSSFALVDEAGATVATSESIGATVTFENLDFTVETGEAYLYLKGTLNSIGEDKVGVLDEIDTTFNFSGIEANGAASGTELAASDADSTIEAGEIAYNEDTDAVFDEAGENATANSKQLGVLASKISSVELVSSGDGYSVSSTLNSGEQIIAIVKVTTDASSNTTDAGSAVKTALSQVTLDINKLSAAAGTSISAATIQNSDSSTTTAATPASILTVEAADTNGSLIFTGLTGSDYEVAAGSTEYFIVKATVAKGGAGSSDDFLQANLSNLDSATVPNFTWTDSADASAKTVLRLSYASVSGVNMAE